MPTEASMMTARVRSDMGELLGGLGCDRTEDILMVKQYTSGNAARLPVLDTLHLARLVRPPQKLRDLRSAAEPVNDVLCSVHVHIKHHVYSIVNATFNGDINSLFSI